MTVLTSDDREKLALLLLGRVHAPPFVVVRVPNETKRLTVSRRPATSRTSTSSAVIVEIGKVALSLVVSGPAGVPGPNVGGSLTGVTLMML